MESARTPGVRAGRNFHSSFAKPSSREGRGSGEPLPDGDIAEETLILKIGEPCLGKGLQLGLQARLDVGFLAGLVIAIYLAVSSSKCNG